VTASERTEDVNVYMALSAVVRYKNCQTNPPIANRKKQKLRALTQPSYTKLFLSSTGYRIRWEV